MLPKFKHFSSTLCGNIVRDLRTRAGLSAADLQRSANKHTLKIIFYLIHSESESHEGVHFHPIVIGFLVPVPVSVSDQSQEIQLGHFYVPAKFSSPAPGSCQESADQRRVDLWSVELGIIILNVLIYICEMQTIRLSCKACPLNSSSKK